VLRDGAIFSSIYKSDPSPILIGGSSITSTHPYTSILVKLDAANQLGGTVTNVQGSPVFPGSVKAFKSTLTGAFPAVDSAVLDAAGFYLIEGLYPGNYTLQVIPDEIQYPEEIPTYLGDAISWDEAQFIDVKTDTKATFMDINLTHVPKLVTGEGNGIMSGNVSYEEEAGYKGTQAKPVTRTSVILIKKATAKGTQEDNVVAYVETDDLGNYIFENVPDGEYILIVDIPGLPMIQTYEVTIEGNKIVSGLDFTVGTQGINTTGNVGVPTEETNRIMLFPNPGNGLIHIVLPDKGDYQLRIFNSVGALVESREYPALSGNVLVDISGLQTGIYILKIEGAQCGRMKYIKE
jgi:hypothetical protein